MYAILLDTHSAIHRFMHAPMEPLQAKDGTITTAAYLYTKLLLKLANKKPDYFILAGDGRRQDLIRRQWYAEYKANRGESSNDGQLPLCHSISEALGIPATFSKGYEADDIIATYTKKLIKKHPDIRIEIYSSDKDLAQLMTAGKNVSIVDVSSLQEKAQDELEAKYGIKIEQLRDYLALVGDSSDNIPGAPGIGPKTATKLLNDYGSIDEIEIDECTPKIADAIQSSILEDSIRLVSFIKVPKDTIPKLKQMRFTKLDRKTASPLFKKLGFKRWVS